VRPPSLDLLRTFLAVYRTGNLTRAAAVLGLTQPTVTAQLRSLETSLGQPLFTRRARGVLPTATSHDLARQVAQPLDALSAVATELGGSGDVAGRTLRIGGPAELMSVRVLPALAPLLAAGVSVRARLGLPQELLAELSDGRTDLVVSTVRPRLSGVLAEPLCDEEFVLVAAPNLAGTIDHEALRTVPARALERLPVLAYDEDLPVVRRWWRHVLGVAPPARAALVVPDLRALREAAVAGLGISVLPRYLCADDLDRGSLTEVLPVEDAPINTLYLAVRQATASAPHIALARNELLMRARTW